VAILTEQSSFAATAYMLHGRPEMMPERQPAESTACAGSPLSTSAPLRLLPVAVGRTVTATLTAALWPIPPVSLAGLASPCLLTCLLWLSVLDEPTVLRCGAVRLGSLLRIRLTSVRPWARTRQRDGTGCEVFRMHIKWAQPEAERARVLARRAMPVARAGARIAHLHGRCG
jgi:hypothetical protein